MGKAESKEKIHWVRDLEKAVLIAGFTGKPVMLMILKSLCPTCQAMEPKYVNSKEFRTLSKFFVMVSIGSTHWSKALFLSARDILDLKIILFRPNVVSPDPATDLRGEGFGLVEHLTEAKSVDQARVQELYAPDGQYVPRIIFLDTTGKPMDQFYNFSMNRSQTRYFYPQADDIVKTMRNVLYYFYPYNKSED